MTTSQRHTLALLFTAILAAVIAYLTLTPPRPEVPDGLLSDKAYHVIAFAALVFPATLLYTRSLIWLIPAALIFGAAIEIIQPFVGRSAEVGDFVADVIGLVCGITLGFLMRKWRSKSGNSQTARSQPARGRL